MAEGESRVDQYILGGAIIDDRIHDMMIYHSWRQGQRARQKYDKEEEEKQQQKVV